MSNIEDEVHRVERTEASLIDIRRLVAEIEKARRDADRIRKELAEKEAVVRSLLSKLRRAQTEAASVLVGRTVLDEVEEGGTSSSPQLLNMSGRVVQAIRDNPGVPLGVIAKKVYGDDRPATRGKLSSLLHYLVTKKGVVKMESPGRYVVAESSDDAAFFALRRACGALSILPTSDLTSIPELRTHVFHQWGAGDPTSKGRQIALWAGAVSAAGRGRRAEVTEQLKQIRDLRDR